MGRQRNGICHLQLAGFRLQNDVQVVLDQWLRPQSDWHSEEAAEDQPDGT
jgi:hypothetical protein